MLFGPWAQLMLPFSRTNHCEVLRGFDGEGAGKLHTVCFYLQAQELGEEEKDQSKASIEEEQSKRTKAAERYGTNRATKEVWTALTLTFLSWLPLLWSLQHVQVSPVEHAGMLQLLAGSFPLKLSLLTCHLLSPVTAAFSFVPSSGSVGSKPVSHCLVTAPDVELACFPHSYLTSRLQKSRSEPVNMVLCPMAFNHRRLSHWLLCG